MNLAQKRHLKISLVTKLNKVFHRLYWTDADVLHGTLKFLSTMYRVGVHAAAEEKEFVDKRYKELYSTDVKLMSGNSLFIWGDYSTSFFAAWIRSTLMKTSTIDDQWSFEELQHDSRFVNFFIPSHFMSYHKRFDVLHLVGENKISKLQAWKSSYMAHLAANIDRILLHIDSFLGEFHLPNFKHSFTVSNSCAQSQHMECFTIGDVERYIVQWTSFDPFVPLDQKVDMFCFIASYLTGAAYVSQPDQLVDEGRSQREGFVPIMDPLLDHVAVSMCSYDFKFKQGSKCARDLLQSIFYDSLYYPKLRQPTIWLTGSIRFAHFYSCFVSEDYNLKRMNAVESNSSRPLCQSFDEVRITLI